VGEDGTTYTTYSGSWKGGETETQFVPDPTANGQFGDAPGSLNIPDFSLVTNVAPKALDGAC
jgi:hypothetical protein